MVQCFIWDILQGDRAKIRILDFGLVPGSVNQFLGVFGDPESHGWATPTKLGLATDFIAIKMWQVF